MFMGEPVDENIQQRQRVRAKTPEGAAKKLFRMSKRKFRETCIVRIYSEYGEEWSFNPFKWTNKSGKKFISTGGCSRHRQRQI